MEINNSSFNKLASSYQKKQVQSSDAQAIPQGQAQNSQATTLAKGDTVNVSSQAKLMTESYTTATADSGVRTDKVAALKEQISSGSYTVDSKEVAKKLLSSESELGLL